MHFLGRLGELPTVYMMTRKPIYLILQLCFDLNLSFCMLTLLLILAFGIYYSSSIFTQFISKLFLLLCHKILPTALSV